MHLNVVAFGFLLVIFILLLILFGSISLLVDDDIVADLTDLLVTLFILKNDNVSRMFGAGLFQA